MAKVTAMAVGERMTVEEFTRQFITKARGEFAGINTVISKHNGYNFNQWYRSYHSRGMLSVDAPESPVDATQALAAAGKVVIGRSKRTGVYLVLPEDSIRQGDGRKAASPLDALTI
mgnify:CR=1 FL=1